MVNSFDFPREIRIRWKMLCKVLVFLGVVHLCSLQEEACFNAKQNKAGYCILLPQCPEAVEGIKKNNFPQTCGFQGVVPFVCCVLEEKPSNIKKRSPGQISREKCKEYSKLRLSETFTSTLVDDDEDDGIIIRDECALENVELIVGGDNAKNKEFPHMVLLGYSPESSKEIFWDCAGSIISPDFILTAAHCLDSEKGKVKYALAGINNRNDSMHRQQRNVKQTFYHPKYSFQYHYYDIALIQVDKFNLKPAVRPACIFTEKNLPTKRAIASGWGRKEFITSEVTQDLLKVILEFFTHEECSSKYRNVDKLPEGIQDQTMICAGSHTELKDSCQGDSGGPLQTIHPKSDAECMYDLVGVISFGKACGLAPELPGVYTRVSFFVEWIENIVWPIK